MKSTIITSALALVSSVVGAPLDSRQSGLQQVTDFGENSSGVSHPSKPGCSNNPSINTANDTPQTKMYIYVPSNVDSKPPVIVAIHYCQGTAQAYFTGSPYAQLADQYGFIVIYPESPYEGTCWDVSSSSALSHNGGGDSNSIANMVSYTLDKYNGDASQVFVTGSSSGAMMTVRLVPLTKLLGCIY